MELVGRRLAEVERDLATLNATEQPLTRRGNFSVVPSHIFYINYIERVRGRKIYRLESSLVIAPINSGNESQKGFETACEQ